MKKERTMGSPWVAATFSRNLRLCMLSGLVLLGGCEKPDQLADEVIAQASGKDGNGTGTKAEEFFHLAILPDTQYYTYPDHGGNMVDFINQMDWIVENKTALEIKYVAHLGDITDHGDEPNKGPGEWSNARSQLNRLFDNNIPFGLAVGNHDQWCYGDPGSGATDDGYGASFGKDKFVGKSWYGGAYGSSNNNDNHYDLFTEDGIKYLVMYIEFNESGYEPNTGSCAGLELYSSTIETNVKNWANGIIAANSDRKVIIVSHSVLIPHSNSTPGHDEKHRNLLAQGPDNSPGEFTTQGLYIYNNIARPNTNVFMMLGGHVTGEGYRVETQNGHVVKAFVSDFQNRPNGGDGYMRIMKFNKTLGKIDIRTIQPLPGPNVEEVDLDSKFTVNMFN